jgi:hypothetical protein
MDPSASNNPHIEPTTTVPAPSSSQLARMTHSSPHGGVILPPPLPQDYSKSTSPQTSLTLPPLSTLSPLMRPSSSSKPATPIITSLSNLLHPEKRGESSTPGFRRESRELSPRAKARRESMNMEAPRLAFPFETIEEHSVLHGQQVARGPRRSMPASASERPYM